MLLDPKNWSSRWSLGLHRDAGNPVNQLSSPEIYYLTLIPLMYHI